MKKFNTPIVVIIYNRKQALKKLIAVLRNIAPTRIFIIADGPKAGEEKKVLEARSVIDEIDWIAKIEKIYSPTNMGLKDRIKSGLDKVFAKVETAIIIEDDCIPSQQFFYFCEELLHKYKDEKKILSISGDNFLKRKISIKDSYYFSRFFHSWGWATWKRAWSLYDEQLNEWPQQKKDAWLEKLDFSKRERVYWSNILDLVKDDRIKSWAYRWSYTHFKLGGLSIVPAKNLVQNVGFGEEATNTKLGRRSLSQIAENLRFPLTHPDKIERNKDADEYTGKTLYATTKNCIVVQIKKWLAFLSS